MRLKPLKSWQNLADRQSVIATKRTLTISSHIATIISLAWLLNLRRTLKILTRHLGQLLWQKRKRRQKVLVVEKIAMESSVTNVVYSTAIRWLLRSFKSSMTIRISQMRSMRSVIIDGSLKALIPSLLLTNLNLLEALSSLWCLWSPLEEESMKKYGRSLLIFWKRLRFTMTNETDGGSSPIGKKNTTLTPKMKLSSLSS